MDILRRNVDAIHRDDTRAARNVSLLASSFRAAQRLPGVPLGSLKWWQR
jgi:hypothetical protein